MKKISLLFILFMAVLLAIGCAQAETEAAALLADSPECGMIGKTYAEIEDSYGPLSTVYIEPDGSPLFLFERTPVGFYFGNMPIPAAWSSYTASGMVPGTVAIRGISPTEVCTGVSGRLKDFGVSDVSAISENLSMLKPAYSEKWDKDVYTLELSQQELIISAFAERDSKAITKETVLRVQRKNAQKQVVPSAQSPESTPSATPRVVEIVTAAPTPDYETPYRTAKDYMAKGNYVEALAILKGLNGYSDSEALMATCQNEIVYQNAMSQYKKKNYKEAAVLFESIGNYKDSELYKLRAQILPSKKGDKIYFGYFEQDDKTSRPEKIQWIVLARTGNKRLLISRYILTTLPFDKNHKVAPDDSNIAESGRVQATWAKSSLRSWLNGTFYKSAFDRVEQSLIVSTRLSNDGNPEFKIKGSSKTTDKIFVLSISEATKYFAKDSARKALKTNYAKNIYSRGKRYNWWWLRNPGMHTDFAAVVLSNGGYEEAYGEWQGRGVDNPGGVRPVMWIDLS